MPRKTLVTLILIALAIASAAWFLWTRHETDQVRRQRTQTERRERLERARAERRREQSRALMPEPLEGVALGMTVAEVRALGRRLEPVTGPESPFSAHLTMYEERTPNGAQIMYGFSDADGTLEQVQVMSLLPRVEAIAPHLEAMNERYGRPTGVWDCPDTEGLPTRRFTWRHAHAAIADVFLVYGGRVSLTLYVATPEAIARSLRLGHCAPVPPERLEEFPTASPERVQRAAEHGG